MTDELSTPETLTAAGWKPRQLPGHMGLVGPLWTRREDDAWAYGLLVEARHLNPAGVVHGGALATLLDHALSAIGWEAAQRQACVTVQLSVQYLAAATTGQFIVARGRVARATASLLFVNGSLWAGDTELVQASTVLKIVRPTSAASGTESSRDDSA